MSRAHALHALATTDATEEPLQPRRGRRRRPCQHCGGEIDVVGGVAVDERHRRGRCAVQAIADAAHEQARTAAEHDRDSVGGSLARFRF